MVSVEERLAYIEGRVEEHASVMNGIREAITSLEQRMDRRFEAIDRRFVGVDGRLDILDEKISRQFMWMVGIQVTTLVAIVAALVAR